jgi:ABC-2 type transport system permease protein
VSAGAVELESLGRPIRGPSALGGDWRRFLHLTWTLAVLELKLKFFGSVLGYLWQLIRPLMMFGVLYVVFTEFVKFDAGVEFYAVVLLTGVVLFTFFSEATQSAVESVIHREGLVRKIQFPRMVIPLSVVLTAAFNLALNAVVVVIFMLASGVQVRATWIQIVPILALLAVYTTGLSMLLSSLYVRFRDIKPIWDVALQVTFYGSPIFYPIETVPSETLRQLLMMNPLAVVVQETRQSLIDPSAPSAAQAIGGWYWLAIPIGIVVAVAVIGFWVFNREAPRIAEEL